jgi:hypothetical protein
MPRASLRSVFTGTDRNTSRTWRISSKTTGSLASRISASAHRRIMPLRQWPSLQADHIISMPRPSNQLMTASGSLARRAYFTMMPAASTMQKCEITSETSISVSYVTVVSYDAWRSPPLTPSNHLTRRPPTLHQGYTTDAGPFPNLGYGRDHMVALAVLED